MTLKWMADRVKMGTWTYVANRLYHLKKYTCVNNTKDTAMKIFKSRGILINLTVLFLAVFCADLIWPILSANPPPFMYSVLGGVGVLLAFLFFLNLGFAMFGSKQKTAYIIMSLLIIITFFAVLPFCADQAEITKRRWFLQEGIQIYQPMADKVMQNKATLTDSETPLDALVGRPYVYGYTNDDGSITIRFEGRGNWMRAGYLYYSGSQMTAKPGNTDLYFIPNNNCYRNYYWGYLTNGWYEY